MKNILLIVLALIICFSGCGKTEGAAVEPEEITAELGKDKKNEISDELIEEIILNFGAKKEEDGTYRITEPFSFYRNTSGHEDFSIIDASANSLYGMGAMLGKEYIEEIYVSDLRYEVYNAETFENMVFEYFGISADILKSTIHYNEFEELGGAGYYWLDGPYYIDENPSLKLENYEENDGKLIIRLKIDYEKNEDIFSVLTVKLLPDGGYNYISYLLE